jgi:hypothetical protein
MFSVFFSACAPTVACMWRSRVLATFLSNRDEVDAGAEPTITSKPGYDIYRLLMPSIFYLNHFNNLIQKPKVESH